MAKSKVGGSRAYIRGRIGADVYSIGKDGKGTRQQVVRSLAEQVSNPRTESQMFGRMVMSTVMQAVSALQPIIDHSFDGLPKGQPSISEFIRTNYALVKADAIAHPAADNDFGLNKYQEKGAKLGKYVVSKGSVPRNANLDATEGKLSVYLGDGEKTVADFLANAGIDAEGYVTLVVIKADGTGIFARLSVKAGVATSTVISSANLTTIFEVDANASATLSFADGILLMTVSGIGASYAADYIISRKENGAYVHSTATLLVVGDANFTSDVALPTYPTGTQQFLNGGDL